MSPAAGLGLAVAGLIAGILLAGILGGIALAATGDEKGPVLLAASFIGLWIPLVTVSLLASRHFGTGSSRDDLGLWVRGSDVGRGAVVGMIGILATSATQLALSPFDELLGTNTNFIRQQADTLPGAVLVVASTMIGAPLVEEIFFRGLLQGALARLGVLAVVLQALVFGLIHFDPDLGLGNVGVVLGVGTFGLVQGLAVRHFGRLGPAFWSHAFFNAAAVVPILVSG